MLVELLAFFVAGTPFESAISENMRDVSFDIKFVEGNRAELRKINQDFANAYEQDSARVQYKEPLLFRIESTMNGQKAAYVINGEFAQWRVPRLGINNKIKIGDAPGKRQTLLDFGVISKTMAAEFIKGEYVKEDSAQAVFDVTYINSLDTSRHRVWVDLTKKVIMKREWYGQNGLLMATFEYLSPVEQNNVWFPTGVKVYNNEHKLAGVSKYEKIMVNAGISDDIFKI